jgi:hypothetical protein
VVRENAVEAPNGTKRPTNLTLSPDALAKAERVALERGTSISQLVEDLLMALPFPNESQAHLEPSVRRLLGAAKGTTAGREDYRAYLYRKHGGRE